MNAVASAPFLKPSQIKKRAFLSAFSRCGSISTAAKRVKIDRRTHYNWLAEDPWYKDAYKQAVQEAGDALEDKLNELALEGNVTAAIFLLKGLRPHKYKERSQVDLLKINSLDDVPENLLKLVLQVLEQEIAAQGEPGQLPAAAQTVDVKPEPPTQGGQS